MQSGRSPAEYLGGRPPACLYNHVDHWPDVRWSKPRRSVADGPNPARPRRPRNQGLVIVDAAASVPDADATLDAGYSPAYESNFKAFDKGT